MVVMTSIPDSEREWVQWKGRTARQDRAGQYKVILNQHDDVFSKGDAPKRLASSIEGYGDEEAEEVDDEGEAEQTVAWYQPKMDRSKSMQYLKGKDNGNFVVRESSRPDAAFTLMFVAKKRGGGETTVLARKIYQRFDDTFSLNDNGQPPAFGELAQLVDNFKRNKLPVDSARFEDCRLVDLKIEGTQKITGVRIQKARKDIVAKLLSVRNTEMEKKLKEQEDSLNSGMNSNRVCDLFYGKYGQGGSWPQAGKHTELRDWLDKHGHGTDRDTCKTFCAQVGLTWIPPENDM